MRTKLLIGSIAFALGVSTPGCGPVLGLDWTPSADEGVGDGGHGADGAAGGDAGAARDASSSSTGSGSACDTSGSCGECLEVSDCTQGARCLDHVCQGCDDAIKNGQETDIDCGGTECKPCGDKQGCVVDGDCVSDSCVELLCHKGGA